MLCYRLMLMAHIEKAHGAIPSILRYGGKVDEKEGTSLKFFVVLSDEAWGTTHTSDALYTLVSSKVEQSKPTVFPTGKWIDWTSATAMAALRSDSPVKHLLLEQCRGRALEILGRRGDMKLIESTSTYQRGWIALPGKE